MDVFTPNLSGCGPTVHLLHQADIGLNAHVEEVKQGLFFDDLQNAVLVGHSYGGLVATAVAALCPERVAGVVLLDGYLLEPGQSGLDFWTPDKAEKVKAALAAGERTREPLSANALGIERPDQVDWVAERLRPHPINCYAQALPRNGEQQRNMEGIYVRCTEGALVDSFAPSVIRARQKGWVVLDLKAGHDAMLTEPEATARSLLEAALILPSGFA